MNIQKDIIVEGQSGKNFLMDIYFNENQGPKPVVIFAHGFKGFKDWGHWELLAKGFANAGCFFAKFNFSHNGTTLDDPLNFNDLKAFGENTYSKELSDLNSTITKVIQDFENEIQQNNITIIGHSRGGGICMAQAARDHRVNKLILWASVSSLSWLWDNNSDLIEKWKTEQVIHIINGRTKQQMPLYYDLYKDYKMNENSFNLGKQCTKIKQPTLILHGSKDPAVPEASAHLINSWIQNSNVHIIPEANHVFNGSHPFKGEELPMESQVLLEKSLDFINS